MKKPRSFLMSTLISGLIIVIPAYLAVLLLLKAMASVMGLVRPLAKLLPDWLPAENLLALLLLLIGCFLVGAAVRTAAGRAARERIEKSLFSRLPGFALLQSLTQQLAGYGQDKVWKPALIEIEDALVPGFIIEELDDGRMAVFVPSVPTPLAGAVYVLDRQRVHILDVPFTQAVSVISRWGAGSNELVAAMGAGASRNGLPRADRAAGAPQPALRP
jgi:uncharacterized membrane protein